MLPPGHMAAGYLVGTLVAKKFGMYLTPLETKELIWWGVFFGFAPDLDMFYSFFKERGLTIHNKKTDHRQYLSHVPIVWLSAAIVWIICAPTLYWQLVGLLIWLGSWTHFVLDSIQYGIQWLWPISHRLFALRDIGKEMPSNQENNFLKYWFKFIKDYSKSFALIFWLEFALIILVGLYILQTRGS
jgi:hypothetical protein